MASQILLLTTLLAITCSLVVAFEPSPLQDFCIANATSLGLSSASHSLYAPIGVIQPHTHPRATEILTVLKGKLNVGLVTSSPENKLISKVLKKGDVLFFPAGLVHYQQNLGSGTAIALSYLSSQNPKHHAVFGSKPAISEDVLAKSFQVDKSLITIIPQFVPCVCIL
ncbi:putative germin-like protein 2-1 [Pyrus communis]|uniref:putative germin-like protein 2-1 n=1 Tax=Pyrus communis TaxID=23211 RepID=UPI0035C03C91